MPTTLAFDVYGTLVDPVEMGKHLETHLGDRAKAFGKLWHEKKVEYAFRRGLMRQYRDFETCTAQALQYCLDVFAVDRSEKEQAELMEKFSQLDAFPDVIPALVQLKEKGHQLVAFSNGTQAALRELLGNAGVLPHLDQLVSVDEVASFKPDPKAYHHLVEQTGATREECWLLSGNPWDVIGAKSAGLRSAWVKRDEDRIFDPWEFFPDRIVRDLGEAVAAI